jgi:hypothetical protein
VADHISNWTGATHSRRSLSGVERLREIVERDVSTFDDPTRTWITYQQAEELYRRLRLDRTETQE